MKISRNKMLFNRIKKLRKKLKVDTQRLREKTLNRLEELFALASVNAKKPGIDVKERQDWVRIAGYIAQVMNSLAGSFDEREVDTQLAELERLVSETRAKTQARRVEAEASAATET